MGKRSALVVLVLASAAPACVPIPAYEGTDDAGDGDAVTGCMRSDVGPASVFATVTTAPFEVPGMQEAVVAFTEISDVADDFCDTTTFTAPAADQYVLCTGLSSDAALQRVELEVVTSNRPARHLARGLGFASGCTVLALAAGETVQVVVVNRGASAATFGGAPASGWLGISTLDNAVDDWGGAEGLASSTQISASAAIPFSRSAGRWSLGLAATTGGTPYLTCAALDVDGHGGTRLRFGGVDYPLGVGTLSDSTGCRIETAAGGQRLEVVADQSATVGATEGDAASNWVVSTALAGRADERRHFEDLMNTTVQAQDSEILFWATRDDVAAPAGTYEFGPSAEAGTVVACVRLDPLPPRVSLDIVIGDQRVEVARGGGDPGPQSGCVVARLPAMAGLHAEVRNPGATAVPVTPNESRFYVVYTH